MKGKRMLALLLAMIMMITALPTTAFAATEEAVAFEETEESALAEAEPKVVDDMTDGETFTETAEDLISGSELADMEEDVSDEAADASADAVTEETTDAVADEEIVETADEPDTNVNYTVEIKYLYKKNNEIAAKSYTGTFAKGSSYEAIVENPVITGYEPIEPEQELIPDGFNLEYTKEKIKYSFDEITQDYTINIYYQPALVDYTVKYYQQNVADDHYTLFDTVTKQGRTEDIVAENYDSEKGKCVGFYGLQFERPEIAADGSTVVEIYYDRNYYLMNFNLEGGYGVEPIYARYGAPIGEIAVPVKPGYRFDGWGKEIPVTMPAENTSYQAQWTAQQANLTVVYWYENANDDGYSFAGSITENATVGTTVNSGDYKDRNFTGKDSTHFTYNAERTETKTVAGDDSTVLNVYFTRNVYTLRFVSSGNRPSTYQVITAKYQADIADQWPLAGKTYGNNTKVPDNLNYWSFKKFDNGNSVQQATKIYTMTDELCETDGSKDLIAYTSSPLQTYNIIYMMESLNGETGTLFEGSYYEKSETYSQELKYSNTSSWAYKAIDGYVPATDKSQKNGNTFTLYYKRNRNTLTFHSRGEQVKAVENIMFEMPLGRVKDTDGVLVSDFIPSYPANLEPGAFEFEGWYTTEECFEGTKVDFATANMPNGPVQLYAHWIPVIHDVNVYRTGVLNETDKLCETQKVFHNTFAVEPDQPTNGEYDFVGWFYMDNGVEKAFDFASMPIKKDLDIYAKWSSNVLVTYIIKYELEDGTEIGTQKIGSALAGTTKTFEAKAGTDLYEGYQEGYFPETSTHSIDMKIEGGNEWTFIYKNVPEVPYTVKYVDKETGEPVAAQKDVLDNTHSVVTETAVMVSGYLPDAFQKRLVLGLVPEENVLYFYYTKDDRHAIVAETHYTVKNNQTTEYSHHEETGTIGETYTRSKIELNGFVLDHVKVNGEEVWNRANGTEYTDPSEMLTADGLHFEFYYTYNRFSVYYQSTNQTVEYPVEADFNVTGKVHSGYLYGGLYTDAGFGTPRTDICGYEFDPVAEATYYVKEVPDYYLCPKIYYIYDKHNNNKLVHVFLVTAVDDEHYQEVGFDNGFGGSSTIYETVTVKNFDSISGDYQQGNDAVLGVNYFFGGSPSSGYIGIQKYTGSIAAAQSFNFRPYFVTPDGVKVTGVKDREVHTGNGNFTNGSSPGLNVADTSVATTVNPWGGSSSQIMALCATYEISNKPAEQFTITKVNGTNVTEQMVVAGNCTGKIDYAEKDGYKFDGWYTDANVRTPADFSNVQGNMTVYAKYVAENSADVNVKETGKDLMTTIKLNVKNADEVGFIYSFEDQEGVVVIEGKTAKKGNSLFSEMFGIETVYSNNGKWKLKDLKAGDQFVVTPYWIIGDSVVYGKSEIHSAEKSH